jgi:hypothetical protein
MMRRQLEIMPVTLSLHSGQALSTLAVSSVPFRYALGFDLV